MPVPIRNRCRPRGMSRSSKSDDMSELGRQDREHLAYLLRRAIANHQVSDIMSLVRIPENANRKHVIQEALTEVNTWGRNVLGSDDPKTEWMEVGNSTKRGYHGSRSSEDHPSLSDFETESWDPLASPSCEESPSTPPRGPRGPSPPVPVNARAHLPARVTVPNNPVNGKPLPEGVASVAQWSSTIYEAPKFNADRLSYLELAQKARDNVETLEHVIWCCNKFGNEEPKPHKVSDFVAFPGHRISDV